MDLDIRIIFLGVEGKLLGMSDSKPDACRQELVHTSTGAGQPDFFREKFPE